MRVAFSSRDKRSRRQPAEETAGQAAAVVENDAMPRNLVRVSNHSTL